MIVEIVTPEATLFKGKVTSVAVPGVEGEFQMLDNHAAIVSILAKGNVKVVGTNLEFDRSHEARFKQVNATTYWLPIQSGTVEMKDNKVIVLAD
jgi:F-type H+-transporting ATPase subunit epsilon